MRNVLLVALGGALGALARFGVATLFLRKVGSAWPWGTLAINVTGCFLIALCLGVARLPDAVRYLVPIGFIGAYTTFSTYEWELYRLAEQGKLAGAIGYLAASNVLGFAAVLLGAAAGKRL